MYFIVINTINKRLVLLTSTRLGPLSGFSLYFFPDRGHIKGNMKALFVIFLSVALIGCANFKEDSEKASTDAAIAYAAIATTINTYEAKPGITSSQIASAEAIKLKAWAAYEVVQEAYSAGQTIDLTALEKLVTEAKSL